MELIELLTILLPLYLMLPALLPNSFAVIFGGGNGTRVLYKIDANRTVTRMKDAPVSFSSSGGAGVLTVDPVSGDYLVFPSDGSFLSFPSSSLGMRLYRKLLLLYIVPTELILFLCLFPTNILFLTEHCRFGYGVAALGG